MLGIHAGRVLVIAAGAGVPQHQQQPCGGAIEDRHVTGAKLNETGILLTYRACRRHDRSQQMIHQQYYLAPKMVGCVACAPPPSIELWPSRVH